MDQETRTNVSGSCSPGYSIKLNKQEPNHEDAQIHSVCKSSETDRQNRRSALGDFAPGPVIYLTTGRRPHLLGYRWTEFRDR